MSTYRLERLFSPRSIALIGGSPRENSLGRIVLTNLKAAGFGGELHVVNPHHREIGGLQTLPLIDRLPHPPDVVVVTAPATAVPQIISESAALGVSAAVVITAGPGHGAGSLAAKAAAEARLHGLRVVGPNGLGLLVPRAKVNASFAARMPPL